ncbi:unnamed protein product [Sphagnum jensenii]
MQSDVVREAETVMQAGRSSLAGQSLQSRSASQPPYAGWLTQVSSVWDQKMMANSEFIDPVDLQEYVGSKQGAWQETVR